MPFIMHQIESKMTILSLTTLFANIVDRWRVVARGWKANSADGGRSSSKERPVGRTVRPDRQHAGKCDPVGTREGPATDLGRPAVIAASADVAVEDRLPAAVAAAGERFPGEQEAAPGEPRAADRDDWAAHRQQEAARSEESPAQGGRRASRVL